MRRAEVHAGAKSSSLKTFRHVRNLELVKLPPVVSVEQAIESYRSHPDVLYAEPNYRLELHAVPSDPSFNSQWHLQNTGQFDGTPGADIKAVPAWDITTGSDEVVVAIIDTGVDYRHHDLAANMWRNEADCVRNGLDDDG
ncbi:MAG TPA: peptidase S8, partial [Verrucomicrobiae bacterium]|nr:peptidase S8 [Verrucomicrobiae bacterium]